VRRWLLLVAALTSGCGSLEKPPLPKFALGEAPPRTTAAEGSLARLRAADVVYFCLTKGSAPGNEQAWKIVAALSADPQPVALGWSQLAAAARQPLLDRWQREEISGPELLGQLTVQERGDWVRRGLRPGLVQVALGPPGPLLRKLRNEESLTAEERALLPRDFQVGPEAVDDFSDRISASSRLRRYNFAALFRAHLAAEQILAENIVRFRRDRPGTKLLIFLPEDIMVNPREVAEFVAQKVTLRQMIIDRSATGREARPPLLATR
jgi:hypothetical protein